MIFFFIFLVFLSLERKMLKGDYDPTELVSALIGKPVPEFNLTHLYDDSINLSNKDLPSKPYIINVWATWCIGCRVEHEYLNKLMKNNITIIGLNYKDERIKSISWLDRLGDPYLLNLFDVNGEMGINMGVYGAPESFFVDADGIIRYRHVGILNDEVWKEKIIPLGIKW